MSEETVPLTAGAGQPTGLLQQMEELMAALNAELNAELSVLGAHLQAGVRRRAVTRRPAEAPLSGGCGSAGVDRAVPRP
ncbi:hypothetical protein ABZT02_05125 [Streptomyces sp. NPDC005402]|uniref:hypothetical protein n=1 Tax=Streptomyces sp. NPDC005402 TaxID=3155338 RepID=UPI00339FDB02